MYRIDTRPAMAELLARDGRIRITDLNNFQSKVVNVMDNIREVELRSIPNIMLPYINPIWVNFMIGGDDDYMFLNRHPNTSQMWRTVDIRFKKGRDNPNYITENYGWNQHNIEHFRYMMTDYYTKLPDMPLGEVLEKLERGLDAYLSHRILYKFVLEFIMTNYMDGNGRTNFLNNPIGMYRESIHAWLHGSLRNQPY